MQKIRLAVIGAGRVSEWHADQINAIDEIVVDSLTDTVRSHAEKLLASKFSHRRPAPTVFVDHRRMLEKTSPEAVLILTPSNVHFQQCVDCLQAGKHVMVQTPMAISSRDAVALYELVTRSGKTFQVASQAPHLAEFQYARKLIASGQLGALQMISGVLAQNWLKPMAGTWRQDPKTSGGGQLYDHGANVLNGMLWLVDSPLTEVFSLLDRKALAADVNAAVVVRFANGCLGTIASGGNCAAGHSELYIQGERGFLNLSLHGGKLVHVQDGKPVIYPQVPWPTESPERNFINVLRGLDSPRCPVRYGVLLAELMEAIYASAGSGVPIKVNSLFDHVSAAPVVAPKVVAEPAPAETIPAAEPAPKRVRKPARKVKAAPARKAR